MFSGFLEAEMKKILVVLTGGTICTEERSYEGIEGEKLGTGSLCRGAASEIADDTLRVRSISDKAGEGLIAGFEASASPFASEVSFDRTENFGILSENMTIERWNILLDFFRALYKGQGEKSLSDYDGIIVAHGTDTLAYSTAIFSILLREIKKPIIFVSANAPLGEERSNGHTNFRKAVESVCLGLESGVFAIYRNKSDGKTLLHRGGLLTQSPEYGIDFHSEGEVDISELSLENYGKCFAQLPEDPVEENPVEGEKVSFLNEDFRLKNCVLQITPYPGLDYSAFIYDKYRVVFHRTYHSGTVCSGGEKETSVLSLVDCCKDGPELWFSPARVNDGVYESVVGLTDYAGRAGVKLNFLYGYTSELVYGWLVIRYS